MTHSQLNDLYKQLMNIAYTLRGTISTDEFRDYILGLIFYKCLSDKVTHSANNVLQKNGLDYVYRELNDSDPEHSHPIELIKKTYLMNWVVF